jgi:hypothetical protein
MLAEGFEPTEGGWRRKGGVCYARKAALQNACQNLYERNDCLERLW